MEIFHLRGTYTTPSRTQGEKQRIQDDVCTGRDEKKRKARSRERVYPFHSHYSREACSTSPCCLGQPLSSRDSGVQQCSVILPTQVSIRFSARFLRPTAATRKGKERERKNAKRELSVSHEDEPSFSSYRHAHGDESRRPSPERSAAHAPRLRPRPHREWHSGDGD